MGLDFALWNRVFYTRVSFSLLFPFPCVLRSSFFVFLRSSFTNSQAEITKKKANQQRRRKQQTQINQKQQTHFSAIWTSVAELLSSSCDDHRHHQQCSDLMGGCDLSTRTKTIFVICGFVPKVGVVSAMGGCFWICGFVLENEEQRKTKKEQGTRVWNTRFPTWKIESQGLDLLDC